MIRFPRILIPLALIGLLVCSGALAGGATLDGFAPREIPFQAEYADNPVLEGVSPTTGLAFDGPYVPILVVYDNAQNARPLVGIAQADIVYQMPNAGAGATKLIGLFADHIPTQAGSVRSARVPFIELREIYNAALVYAGGPTSDAPDYVDINRSLRDFGVYSRGLSFNVIGAQQEYMSTVDGKGTYYNTMADLRDIRDALLAAGAQFDPKPFRFTDALPTGGTAATDIEIAHFASKTGSNAGHSGSWARYAYDAETNAYARMVDTGAFADYADPAAALRYANLIVMRTEYRFSGNYVLLPGFVGQGVAEIFMGGRYIAGGWIHPSFDSRIVFVDENGGEVALQRGKTFIVVANQATRVTYSAGE